MTRSLRITAGRSPFDQKVVMDGVDITSGLQRINLVMEGGQLPTAWLQAAPAITDVDLGEVHISVDVAPGLAAILEAQGWTPPKEG